MPYPDTQEQPGKERSVNHLSVLRVNLNPKLGNGCLSPI